MSATIETAIRACVSPGKILPTPTGTATFIVAELNADGVVLLLGPQRTRTLITWPCLEGVPAHLSGHRWQLVAANRDVSSDRGFDGYLKRWIKRQVANYVAVLLEHAGVVELDRERPARFRLADRRYLAG